MSEKSIRIALVGASGRMGRFTQELLEDHPDLELVARIDRGEDISQVLEAAHPDVALDFTMAGVGADHGRVMLECGVRPLLGTSGIEPADDASLDAEAQKRGLGGLVVPNFCLGVWLQQEFALRAAAFLPSVEIVEEHHHEKLDAPSGTAADTAVQLAEVRGVDPADIPIHSLRLQGLYSNQSVVLGGPGEVLRITHENYGLEAFGPGILTALRYVAQAEGVARGIGHAFEWQRAQGKK